MYMNFARLLINLLGGLFEVYLILHFFSLLLEQRGLKKSIRYAIYLFSLILLVFSGQLTNGLPFGPLMAFLALFLILNTFNTKFITKLIMAFIILTIFLFAEMLTGMLLVMTGRVSIEETRNNMFIYLCAIVLSKFLVFFLILFIREKVTINKLQKPKFAFYILAMPLSSAFTIYLLFFLTYDLRSNFVFVVALAVILLVVANIATLYIIDRLLEYESNKEKLQYMQIQFQVQEEHYRELEQKQYEINEFYHNMKNFLLAIEGYIDDGEYMQAKEKIRHANEIIHSEYHNRIKTGNTCLDALLNAKIIRMQRSEIEFEYNVRIPNELSIDYIDLCIIIGNALDNAIEACEKINGQPRRISLTCIQTGSYISIVIVNTIDKDKPILKDQDYATTKADRGHHGYGLRSIRHIAEKNKGNVIIEHNDDVFQLKIILYNELV